MNRNSKFPFRKIFISGASSGLGFALAVEFAEIINNSKLRDCHIGLLARREDKLSDLKTQIESQYLSVHLYKTDVTHTLKMKMAVEDFLNKAGCIDLVIANAGISSGTRSMPVDTIKQVSIINVNVNGVINTLNPFLDKMILQKFGHISAIGSVAGFRGLPGGSYSASKSAVKTLMDSWRLGLRKHNINVTTLCPGFVKSAITDKYDTKFPFIIESDKAAKIMINGLIKKKKTLIFPAIWRFVVPIMKIIPDVFLSR